jgi:hypothetical protein
VIGVLLALVMRSLIAPLYLIASVALSYFAALGLAVILFIELGHSGGITFILPFLLFIFLLALGEDYNILVMTRIREEAHHYPLREAVSRALSVTGTTVTSAGLVLAGTFAVFAVVGGRGSGGDYLFESTWRAHRRGSPALNGDFSVLHANKFGWIAAQRIPVARANRRHAYLPHLLSGLLGAPRCPGALSAPDLSLQPGVQELHRYSRCLSGSLAEAAR